MSGISESAYQVQVGLETAIKAVLAADGAGDGVGFFWGDPPPTWPREMVLLMDTGFELDTATMGSNRTRDEIVNQQVVVLVARQGDGAQKAAAQRAYGLVSAIEEYIREQSPTLGVDGCYECLMTLGESTGTTNPADRSAGRWAEINCTFTAKIRISK